MSCGIYKITNIINNKVYIGKAINIERRWIEHRSAAKNLNNTQSLYCAIRKYQIENFQFEIIEKCEEDNKILSEREKYWIEFYHSYENGYNETRGGDGKFLYKPSDIQQLWDQGLCSKEIQKILGCGDKIIHQALNGYNDYTVELSQLRSNGLKEKREKLSKLTINRWGTGPVYQYALNGEYLNEYPSMSVAARSLGYHKDQSIYKALNDDNRSNIAYGFLWSKEKVDYLLPRNRKKAIYVRNLETGTVFSSLRQAALWAHTTNRTIKKSCEFHTAAGVHPDTKEKMHWEFL